MDLHELGRVENINMLNKTAILTELGVAKVTLNEGPMNAIALPGA